MGLLIVEQGQLVLPERVVTGDLVCEDGVISAIVPRATDTSGARRVDARGKLVFPGLVDSQAHFREFTRWGGEDLHSGSCAAAAGGVTTVLEMPDSDPADAHSLATLHHKLERAAERCVVHYGLWMRATPDNLDELVAATRTVGVRVALDCSPDQAAWASRVFASVQKPVAVHAEDRSRLAERYAMYEGDANVTLHPRIRDVQTAVAGTELALQLAARHGTRLHLLHLSSAEEVELLRARGTDRVTAAVALPHLFLDASSYATEGTRVQGNPPLRDASHRTALWAGLRDGTIAMVASDHCPHGLDAKSRSYPQSASGMPGVEWLLPLLVDAALAGRCTLNDVARWGSDAPASTLGIARKGRLEVGYDADFVLVDPTEERTLRDADVRSAAGWTPYRGRTLRGWPVATYLLGKPVFVDGQVDTSHRGRELASS
ncbi:MAG: amidohydrolase family protein [Alphaproteobacteria bacterium]|nr:amidohydrolase family protein [Alphaproteobacteria bacterium]